MGDYQYDPTAFDDVELDYRTPGFESRSVSPLVELSQRRNGHGQGLPLLQLSDWDEDQSYDETPPTCVHYSIEWKLLLNKGRLSKLTYNPEQVPNLVLAPGAFWNTTLKLEVEKLLQQKTPRQKCYKPEETNIVVSVSDRAERDFKKRFDEFNIEWDIIEQQLITWSPLFRGGKKLRIEISFICKDATQTTAMRTRQSTRGATGRQLAELDEEEAVGKTFHWRNVYSLMRCTGPPCQGRHCWRDPNQGHKHFSLEPHVLQKLVEYAEDGQPLTTHDEVPQYIRDLILAKDEADSERRKKKQKVSSVDGTPHIHIHMPGQPNASNESSGISNLDIPVSAALRGEADLCIPGARDDAIKRYCQWHCTQVNNNAWKAAFIKAGSITLEQGLDLKHVYADRDVEFYVKEGVLRGIARSFVEDVKRWVDKKEE